jgi:autotransporter-associated beta strand protein
MLTALALGPGSVFAAPLNWTNTGAGLFGLGTNWDGNTVPTAGDAATIANGGIAQIVAGDGFAFDSLTVSSGGIDQSGGSLSTSGRVTLGSLAGTVNFNQTGGTFSSGERLYFADGAGSPEILSSVTGTIGGTVTASDYIVVGRQGGTADLTVTGLLQKAGGTNRLIVGDGNLGIGTVTVSGFGQLLSDTQIDIGNGSGSNGTVIAKDDAFVVASGNLIVGGGAADGPENANTGVGSLTVSDRATVSTSNEFWVGNNTGSTGTVDLNGGSIQVASWIGIGRRGTGTVNVNGGTLDKIGGNNVVVGDLGGNGTLNVNAGAVNISNQLWVGNGPGSVGELKITGGTVTTQSWIAIGRDANGGRGVGTLDISGGTLTKEGDGNLTLNGSLATVNQTGGTLNVTYSDAANTGETWMSEFDGTETVWNASGGTANLGKITRIGYGGNATVNISQSAVMNNGIVYIGSNGASTGTLNLRGGTFAASRIEEGAGQGFINFDGGTLKATENRTGADTSFLPDFEDSDLNVQAGGVKVDSNGFNVEITQALAGVGGLLKEGQGELILSNAGTAYAGDTLVNAGKLSVAGAIFNDFSSIYITDGAVLGLNFTGMDDIAGLWLGGVFQSAGTYGAIGSGAMFESDDFTGTGMLNVAAVPEPGTIALVAGGLGLIALRVRRKSA